MTPAGSLPKTPPPTTQKPKNRMMHQPRYYEDYYGVPNSEEEFEQYPDDCESESDSDDGDDDDDDMKQPPSTKVKDKPDSIFGPFMRGSKSRQISGEVQQPETSQPNEIGAIQSATPDIFSNIHLPYNNQQTPRAGKPNLFQKYRVPPATTTPPSSATKKLKLRPKKFGKFDGAPLTPDNMDPINNTTDTFGGNGEHGSSDYDNGKDITTNGEATGGDFNELMAEVDQTIAKASLPTSDLLGELQYHPAVGDVATSETTDIPDANAASSDHFDLAMAAFTQHAEAGAAHEQVATEPQVPALATQTTTPDKNATQTAPPERTTARSSPMPGMFPEDDEIAMELPTTEDDTGYQADQDEIQTPQRRGRGRPKKNAATPSPSRKEAGIVEGTPRSTRSATTKQLELEAAEKIANRLRKRQKVASEPMRVSPRTQAVAKAGKKGKKVVTPASVSRRGTAVVSNGVSKKSVAKGSRKSSRLEGVMKNWKGENLEVVGNGKGYVKIVVGEDGEEYEKYY